MLRNSSFEVATNPDTPDYWGRDLNKPPFGEDVWALDAGTAFHGKKSLRIGVRNKFVRYWLRGSLKVVKETTYTFSVYLKSDRPDTSVKIRIRGMDEGEQVVTVASDWKRHLVSGKAGTGGMYPQITLLSDGVLWVDAAQLEPGKTATPYSLSPRDAANRKDGAGAEPVEPLPGPAPVEVRAAKTDSPPRIDGKLDDDCWREAQEMSSFFQITGDKVAAKQQTTTKLCYDDRALYFMVRAEQDDMDSVRKLLADTQGCPWLTDLVEFFIDFNHDRSTYYQFAVNANGDTWHSRRTTQDLFEEYPAFWNADWQVKGSTDSTGWTVEAALPFTCFDLRPRIRIGPVIGLNVCRTSNPDPKDRKRREYSSWSHSPGGFENPSAMGVVKGLEIDRKPCQFEVVGLGWYRGVARVSLKNDTGENQNIEIAFRAELSDGTVCKAETEGTSKNATLSEMSAPLRLEKPGLYKMHARIVDESGVERHVSQFVNVRIQGSGAMDLAGTEYDFYTKETEARARCFVELGDKPRKDLVLKWWVERNGKPVGKVKGTVRPKSGINVWTVPLEKVPSGSCMLHAVLVESGKQIAEGRSSFRKLAPSEHEVRINRWGRFLVYDGKPFLWYGFYSTLSGEADQTSAILKDIKGVNSTAVLNYAGYEPNVTRVLDQADQLGLKMWVHLQRMTTWPSPRNRYGYNEETATAALAEVVIKHRNHPALLGWCTIDEPGNKPTIFTKEYAEKWYRLIKALDPYHPCMFSHLTSLKDFAIYGNATDLAMIPFGEGARHEHLFQQYWDAGLPISVNCPCYDAGVTVHAPTPSDQRIRMYKAIILGARGVSTYTYRCTTTYTWREFARIGKELETLAHVLLTPDNRLKVEVTPPHRKVSAALKAQGGKFYLLAVNRSDEEVACGFLLTDVPSVSEVKPMFDSVNAKMDSTEKKVDVRMNVRSTAFYEIIP